MAEPDDTSQPSTFGGGPRARPHVHRRSEDLRARHGQPLDLLGTEHRFRRAGTCRCRPGFAPAASSTPASSSALADAATQLYGSDLYVKFKPPNQSGGYFSVAWQSEYYVRHSRRYLRARATGGCGVSVNRRTRPTAASTPSWWCSSTAAGSWACAGTCSARPPSVHPAPGGPRAPADVTFVTSEFARLRLYGERETRRPGGSALLRGPANYMGLLQLEIAMGAHGAHAF